MRFLLLLLLGSSLAAQSFGGRSTETVRIVPPYKFCLGEDNGKDVCIIQSGVNTATATGNWNFAGSTSFPLTAPSGTSAAPSYSFSSSTGSGMWLASDLSLRLNIGGGALGTYGFGCGTAFAFSTTTCGISFANGDGFVFASNSTNPTVVIAARAFALGGHLNQNSALLTTGDPHDLAGTCAMSASTSCTWSLGNSFTNAPICIATAQGATAIAAACNVNAGSLTVTITAASANSLTWGAMVIGNPN